MRYAAAILLGSVAIGPVVLGAVRLRRRFLADLPGSASAVAVLVMVLTAVVGAAELLGTFGAFRRIAMCLVLAVAGLVACRLGSGRTSHPPVRLPATPGARVMNIAAAAVIGLVGASWTGRTVAALRHGMETIDTLWYHMPTAARFVQTGSTTALHHVDAEPVTVFYPATSSLLHGFALQLFGNDFPSPFFSLGWLALVLLAGWAIGAPYGVAPVTMTGAAIVAGTPGWVATQPGGAYTDVVGLALFLAAVALLVHARRAPASRLAVLVVAALAAGLALGTKFTLIAPVGALTLAVLADSMLGEGASDRRWRDVLRSAAAWCIPLALAGGYFYVRNAVRVDNPLPSLSFGPLDLPTPTGAPPTFTVAQYIFRASIWRDFYVPGLWQALGPAWWAITGAAIVAAVVAIVGAHERMQRLLGGVVLASLVAFLMTPQFLGFANRPVYFVVNLRYLSPALALGLCLLPTLRPFVRAAVWLFGAYAAALVVTQYGPTIWSWSASGLRRSPFFERIDTSDVVLGVAAVVAFGAIAYVLIDQRARTTRLRSTIAIGAIAIVLVICAYPVQRAYLDRRYDSTFPLPETYEWAQSVHDERIGLIGVVTQYPLYGDDASNHVQYIGRRGADGTVERYENCAAWRRAINEGRYDFVLITPQAFGLVNGPPAPPALEWTLGDPNSHVERREEANGATAVLVRLTGPLDPNSCGTDDPTAGEAARP